MADDYRAKLERERRFYTEQGFRHDHPLNSRLFYSRERNAFAYAQARRRVAEVLPRVDSLLVAPIGTGSDLPYVKPLARRISGVDISPEAVAEIVDSDVDARVGDMLQLPYDDETFDAALVSLFFHHYGRQGFDPFLREIRRVLRSGGTFVTLEPSALHPTWWVAWLLRRLVGNISGTVADERPLRPKILVAALDHAGFEQIEVEAAAFPHPRMPVPAARLINGVAPPLVRLPLVKQLAWTFVARARKPG